MRDSRGAYTAERASALTGVPKSTVYYWARKGYVVPSSSPQSPKLWSFSDLLALRAVYWLRQPKDLVSGGGKPKRVVFSGLPARNPDIPRTSMPAVREALGQLRELDLDLFVEDPSFPEGLRPLLLVNRGGELLIHEPSQHPRRLDGQLAHGELMDLLAPMETAEGTLGPHLLRPRPLLRIVPKKLGGSPHVKDTRVETLSLAALQDSGYTEEGIARLYPFIPRQAVHESVDLEGQLRRNLEARAAA